MYTSKLSRIRLKLLPIGYMSVHDRLRNLLYDIYPFGRNKVDKQDIYLVAKTFLSRLDKEEVFRILKWLDSLDQGPRLNWS